MKNKTLLLNDFITFLCADEEVRLLEDKEDNSVDLLFEGTVLEYLEDFHDCENLHTFIKSVSIHKDISGVVFLHIYIVRNFAS